MEPQQLKIDDDFRELLSQVLRCKIAVINRNTCAAGQDDFDALAEEEKERITITFLKPQQSEGLIKSLDGDCFIALKTGYGKSLIFELLPFVLDSIVIIICPLDVIIDQFLARFYGAVELSESILSKDPKTDFNDVRYLIGHPEAATSKEMCQFLGLLHHKVCCQYLYFIISGVNLIFIGVQGLGA